MTGASFVVNGKSTPLCKIVHILEYVNQQEVVGALALDNYMMDQCGYRNYNFRIDIREQLKKNGWLGYNQGEYYIRFKGRRVTQGFARILPERERPARYRHYRAA